MPPNYRQQQGHELTSNEKRGTVVLGAVVLLAGAGLGVWALAGGGSGGSGSGTSAKGPCVSVGIPSSTGGSEVRQCGDDARKWCAAEATGSGLVASEVKAACKHAGLLAAG
jgi:hypothetical protein